MKMDPTVRGKPVMTFADRKAMFFCGNSLYTRPLVILVLSTLAYLPDKTIGMASDAPKEVDETLSSSMFGCQIPVEDCPDDLFERDQEGKWNFIWSQFQSWAPE